MLLLRGFWPAGAYSDGTVARISRLAQSQFAYNRTNSTWSPPGNVMDYREKRRTPRYPFIAVAEITDIASGAPLNSQVAELSLNGCYVDMLNTLPINTKVTLKIFAESECFEATASVIYAQQGLGMGLAFHDVSLKSGTLLRRWLQKAGQSQS